MTVGAVERTSTSLALISAAALSAAGALAVGLRSLERPNRLARSRFRPASSSATFACSRLFSPTSHPNRASKTRLSPQKGSLLEIRLAGLPPVGVTAGSEGYMLQTVAATLAFLNPLLGGLTGK